MTSGTITAPPDAGGDSARVAAAVKAILYEASRAELGDRADAVYGRLLALLVDVAGWSLQFGGRDRVREDLVAIGAAALHGLDLWYEGKAIGPRWRLNAADVLVPDSGPETFDEAVGLLSLELDTLRANLQADSPGGQIMALRRIACHAARCLADLGLTDEEPDAQGPET